MCSKKNRICKYFEIEFTMEEQLEIDNLLLFEDDVDGEEDLNPTKQEEEKSTLFLKEEEEQQTRLLNIWKEIKNHQSSSSTPAAATFPVVKFISKVRNRHLIDANEVYDCNAW